MIRYSITAAAVLLLACFAYGETGTATFSVITDQGEYIETVTGEYMPAAELQPMDDPPEVLWHYIDETIETMYMGMAPMGYESGYVFAGGFYVEARMFLGITGDGSVLWDYAPVENCERVGTVAATTADIFYSVFNWDEGCTISCFTSQSDTPTWTYNTFGSFDPGLVSFPGKIACSADGSVLAVGGSIEGHLGILFFSPEAYYPLLYEDETVGGGCSLRITADGSKCIFRRSSTLYRVDTATGTLEASYALDVNYPAPLGVSPDGSVVAYGATPARIAVWDGQAYNLEAEIAIPGYHAYQATVAADNSTVYFGLVISYTYENNRIIRYDLDTSTQVWSYDYEAGSGDYQELISWMDCSDDGRWMVAGSWGLQEGGSDEVNVFDDLNPSAPAFSINTPGSIWHVDISSDGRYVSAAGKHVHANEAGHGGDVYLVDLDIMGIEGGGTVPSHFMVCPNPSSGSFSATFSVAEPCDVSIELFDLGGRLVHSESSSVSQRGDASMQLSTDLPSGIYTCRLNAGSEENTTRLVITR
jgi:hypothetical protein